VVRVGVGVEDRVEVKVNNENEKYNEEGSLARSF
jgi:hypothetical protein